jgi:hypothetical protein
MDGITYLEVLEGGIRELPNVDQRFPKPETLARNLVVNRLPGVRLHRKTPIEEGRRGMDDEARQAAVARCVGAAVTVPPARGANGRGGGTGQCRMASAL